MSCTRSDEHRRTSGAWSIALRLTTCSVALTFVILVTASTFLYLILVNTIHHRQDEYLWDKVHIMRELLNERPDRLADLKEEVEEDWAPRQYSQVYTRVITGDGHIVAESPLMSAMLKPQAFPAPLPPHSEATEGCVLSTTSGDSVRALSVKVRDGSPAQTAIVQVALNTQRSSTLMAGYRQTLMLVLGCGLAAGAALGYWLVRVNLRPLRHIAATAQRITSSNLQERIELVGLPSELSSVMNRFNAMLDRLQDSFNRLSRFSADIAHELRTPVNNMRIEAEVALGNERSGAEYRETLGSCLEECDRLGRIIDSLLFIARAEDPRTQIRKEPVDIARELERTREFYDAPAGEAGVLLTVSSPPDIVARVDRTLFQRALGNLVANAIQYTPRGGRIWLDATLQEDQLMVTVSDTGAGIDPEELPRVFDRFYRADRARSTSSGHVGLGLAIVRSIVLLHGGTIEAHSELRRGTRMSITLPMEAVRTHEILDEAVAVMD